MLQEKLNELFMDRSSSHREAMTEEEVIRLDAVKSRAEEIYKALREMLPEGGWDLLFELDSIIGEERALKVEGIYRVGLKDGMKLAEGLRVTWLNHTLKPVLPGGPRPSNFKDKQITKKAYR